MSGRQQRHVACSQHPRVRPLDKELRLTALHQVDNPGRVRLFDLLARPGFGLADRVPG